MVSLDHRNGFRLLKPGGTLVYSTCSLSLQQNEDIVQYLLRTEPHALLEPLEPILQPPGPSSSMATPRCACPWRPSEHLPGTIIFHPSEGVSGLFIARIRKV